MPDLSTNCGGIHSPNPFWLASGPPTNSGDQVARAFDLGWGGVVWKTLGASDMVQNASSRFGAIHSDGARVVGFNNNELITDRSLAVNYREMADIKKRYPRNALVASLMFGPHEEWVEAVRRCEDIGVDGFELNFGCPHGMCERGMGSAVGQEPKINEQITRWVRELTPLPVLVKLTPNVSDIVPHGLAAQQGGADGVSLINTVKSIIGVDIDQFVPLPVVGASGTNGGYCGPAVRPIALHMVGCLARHPEFRIPISGIGGVSEWRHAVEFILLGCSSVQVCTAAMVSGFRIVEDMIDGLGQYMRDHRFDTIEEMVGRAVPNFVEWGDLDLNFESVARIDKDRCIGCHLCYVACRDGSHHCVKIPTDGTRVPTVDETECVGCNLCQHVCPVPDCIRMVPVENGLQPCTWKRFLAEGKGLRAKKGVHD